MRLYVRKLQSPTGAIELFLTVLPEEGTAAQQAQEAYRAIAQQLREHKAVILQERALVHPTCADEVRSIRREVLKDLDDGIQPTWLIAPDTRTIAGIQVYAVAGVGKPRILRAGPAAARVLENCEYKWIVASGLCATADNSEANQTRSIFEQVDAILAAEGADLKSLARTWIFMDKILQWYGTLNQVRTTFFKEKGVIGPGTDGRLPASTGIGVSPLNTAARCTIDMFAVTGPDGAVKRHAAAGKQRSAYEYGSAFARSATIKSPAGNTVFVSGTAAIDTAGRTCFLNDVPGQIQMTMDNVVAVLCDHNCSADDVVHAIAYCATQEVKDAFLARWAREYNWPCITVIGDVCRDDLLFEVEATAVPGVRTVSV